MSRLKMLPYCDELIPTEEPIGTPVVIINPTPCPDTCIDPPFPTTVAMSAPLSINGDMCIVRPTATPSATVTNIFATVTPATPYTSTPSLPQPSTWYVTRANLTDGLIVRQGIEATSLSIPPLANPCTAVTRLGNEEYDDPVSRVTRVKILWPLGSTNVGYIAIRDASMPQDGDYLVDNYDSLIGPPHNCPAPTPTPIPTATFDPSIPLFSPGRFGTKANGTPLQIASVFTAQSPATVGIMGIHEGGTVDLAPRNYQDGRNPDEDINSNLEFCLDAGPLDNRSNCDGVTVYYPVNGCAIRYANEPHRIYLLVNCEGYNEVPKLTKKAQRQIHFYHIDPSTSSLPFDALTGVIAGDVVGQLCTHNNREDCDIQGAQNFSHLALRLVFKLEDSDEQIGADDDEIKGFVGTPRCLYDNWANIPGKPTIQSNPVHGCPQ